MPSNSAGYLSALRDFRHARQQAALQEIIGRLTGRSTRLLSFEEVEEKLRLANRTERGIHHIPLKAIVGSVGRYTDFTRTFLPRMQNDEQRWARVKTALDEKSCPPIDVYKVGEVYFVQDGNHRVSIARQSGAEFIDASVIEVQALVPFSPNMQPDELILKAEYAEFLARTHLQEHRPTVDIVLTAPGYYQRMIRRIELECYVSQAGEYGSESFEQAALCWYDEMYLPLVEAIHEECLIRWFPKRTEADLALWIAEHRAQLENEQGWTVQPAAAASDLAMQSSSKAASRASQTGTWRASHMTERYVEERLFKDILVPLSGEQNCWDALEQALAVAAREDAFLHGLHVTLSEKERDEPCVQAMEARFEKLCRQAGVRWDFHVESGEIAERICVRSRLADLVVLNTAHPPQSGLTGRLSGLRRIIWKCPRPLLAACCTVTPMDRMLLAYDDSPKAREALFVAAYLAGQWMASLTVFTLTSEKHTSAQALERARAYLELHEIQADYLPVAGQADSLHALMDNREINFLLMGGYSGTALDELMAGSLVNLMLRINHCPILICR